MSLHDLESIEKAQKGVEKMNGKFVSKFISDAVERHVKEENEPMLDKFINDLQVSYAIETVGKSMREVYQLLKK